MFSACEYYGKFHENVQDTYNEKYLMFSASEYKIINLVC